MFSKVLVANRGEIAVRIIRACRELGVKSLAVYSDADAGAPHVREADEAVNIGPPPSRESYLVGDRIIEVAKDHGAQAIHPGYGFLSERDWFARAVRDAALVFIGPSAEAIAAVGSKTAARTLAVKNNVPVVPGTTEAIANLDSARELAEKFGYPILLKAAAGGGGKGMRVVRDAGDLESSLGAAQREAKNAFGDDAVYIEKYIEGPRHVEIQILGDKHGNMLSLGERECSVQRRHQKMVEESPSVAVSSQLRHWMGESAVRLARAAGYVNAGTCEFLLDQNDEFYFLEMNTRLQVEHPVTEFVTGIDLVQWQLRIAAGERLPFLQNEIKPRGWAMECRITSEDTAHGFLPSTGRIEYLHIPSGPGVRWDGGIETGSEVGLHYDPLLAKLIVWAATRELAIERMHRALLELTIDGIETSRDFHLRLMEDGEFRRGEIEIQWLERRLASLVDVKPPTEVADAAVVVAALLAATGRQLPAAGQPQRIENEPVAVSRWPAAALYNECQSPGSGGWKNTARTEGLR